MKKNNKGFKFLFIFLLIITVISAVITFKIADKGNRLSEKVMDEVQDNTEDIEGLEKKDALDDKQSNGFQYSNSLFDGVDAIYIYNPKIESNVVEVTDKDKSFIISYLKGITKNKSSFDEMEEDIEKVDNFDYKINIPSINIKINLYQKGYIVFKTKDDISAVYRVDSNELQGLLEILEGTYLDKQLYFIRKALPDKVYINARDENNVYILEDKEIKEIMDSFQIISLENNSDYRETPALYPDYYINLYKGEEKYNLHLINKEVMIIETPLLYLYCKYNSELWEYVQRKIPARLDYKENELEYLFNSEKVIINDISGNYNMHNDTYYNIMIPRWIKKSEYKKIDSPDNILHGEVLKYNLRFLVEGKWKEVLIYDNYIVYEDNIYLSKNINEAITSLLIAP